MPVTSAGILVHRVRDGRTEFLLVHPGGPFWARKDDRAWSIPKGVVEDGEATWDAARREFAEELGRPIDGDAVPLPVRKASKKTLVTWLVAGDLDADAIVSNDFEIEWPPRSGRLARFPEVDRAAWFDAATARTKIHAGQEPILDDALARLAAAP